MRRFSPEGGFRPIQETAPKTEQVEEDLLDIDTKDKPPNRGFGRGVVATFGILAVTLAMWVGSERYGGEAEDAQANVEAKEKTDIDRYEEYVGELKKAMNSIKETINSEKGLTAHDKKDAEHEAVSEYFQGNPENLEKLNEMVDLIASDKDPNILASKLFNELSNVGAQDLFYSRLRESGEYKEFVSPQKDVSISGKVWDKEAKKIVETSQTFSGGSLEDGVVSASLENHFSTSAKDFLPTGEEVSLQEIDQRIIVAEKTQSVANSILQEPQWLAPEKRNEFKKVLDDASVREVLQSDSLNLDLSQSYSLIKIAIGKKEAGDARSHSEIIKELAHKQEREMSKEVLGGNTENFIFVAGYDEFDVDSSYRAPEYESLGEKMGAKNIVGFSEKEGMEKKFKQTIEKSTGKTFILIDAHSSADLFELNASRKEQKEGKITRSSESISAKEFAKVLLERANKGESLADVTILLGGCETYGLAENIVKELKKQAGEKKVAKMELPTIITSVTGSSPIEQNAWRSAFDDFVNETVDKGNITLEDIIKTLGPKVSGNGGDQAVFIGEKGGVEEVASVQNKDISGLV